MIKSTSSAGVLFTGMVSAINNDFDAVQGVKRLTRKRVFFPLFAVNICLFFNAYIATLQSLSHRIFRLLNATTANKMHKM